eukprot:7635667-Alexandrium_andersonii.AAC.1
MVGVRINECVGHNIACVMHAVAVTDGVAGGGAVGLGRSDVWIIGNVVAVNMHPLIARAEDLHHIHLGSCRLTALQDEGTRTRNFAREPAALQGRLLLDRI